MVLLGLAGFAIAREYLTVGKLICYIHSIMQLWDIVFAAHLCKRYSELVGWLIGWLDSSVQPTNQLTDQLNDQLTDQSTN